MDRPDPGPMVLAILMILAITIVVIYSREDPMAALKRLLWGIGIIIAIGWAIVTFWGAKK